MPPTPSYVEFSRQALEDAHTELIERFGRSALEETAYPVYMNSFMPASYLGWSRVVHAQRLLSRRHHTERALDFGSGLGVMLPFLSQRYGSVVAYDLDPSPTEVMVDRMRLPGIELRSALGDDDTEFDAVVALDVLEHVPDLGPIYDDLLARTSPSGCWVISGPTENWLYHAMRRLARTSGEGHVRTIYDVFDAVPKELRLADSVRLPFGSPVPLFLVGRFERA